MLQRSRHSKINTSGSKVWCFGNLGYRYPYNINKKNTYACVHLHSYICLCTYICLCMHYMCVNFSHIQAQISLSHILTSSPFLLGSIISAMHKQKQKRFWLSFTVLLYASVTSSRLIHIMLHPRPNTHHFQPEMEHFLQVKTLRWPNAGKNFMR